LQERWLNFPGPPHEFRAVNFDKALSPQSLPQGYFRDKIVVVGARPEVGVQADQAEAFRNPYSKFNRPLATGAAIHATSLLNLVRGDWLSRLNYRSELGIIIAWGAVMGIVLMVLHGPFPFSTGVPTLGAARHIAFSSSILQGSRSFALGRKADRTDEAEKSG